jgi:RNA polymerase sigma factor (sigma-70 family)
LPSALCPLNSVLFAGLESVIPTGGVDMATAQMVWKHIHRLWGEGTLAGRSDSQLLAAFLTRRDETAFAALVARHGPMVLGTCRAVLKNSDEAEDAFQATFLVLARKGGSVRGRDALGGWLHRVAYRAAVQAGRAAARRRKEERRAAEMRAALSYRDESNDDLRALIHAEVERLPGSLRLPVVLCDLEGLSREQAAQELHWSEGTLRGRLARGRDRLRARLVRRGMTLSVGTLASAMSREATAAAVPQAWAAAAVRVASASLAGEAVSGTVAVLAGRVIHSLIPVRLIAAAGATLILGAVAWSSAGRFGPAGNPPREANPPIAANLGPAPADGPKTLPEGTVTYQGRVLGPDGKAVEGARLRMGTASDPAGPPTVRARSGADGRFRFEVAKAEFGRPTDVKDPWRYALVVVSADGFGPNWASHGGVPVREDDPAGDGLTIQLVERGEPIVGRVLDLQGRPVAGATVRLERLEATESGDLTPYLKAYKIGEMNSEILLSKILFEPALAGLPTTVTADASGRFRIEGVGRERGLKMRISGPGIEETMIRALTRPGLDHKALTEVGPETSMMMPGIPSRNGPPLHGTKFDVLVGPGRSLSGVVREAGTGKPIAGVQVSGMGEGHSQYLQAVTDAGGKYRLQGLPMAAKITLSFYPDKGETYLPASQVVEARDAASLLTAEIELTRGITARGRVIDKATGKPVQGSILYQPLAGNTAFRDTPAGEFIKHVINGESIGEDGTFRVVVGPGPGVILIQVQSGPPGGEERARRYLPARRDPNDGAPGFGGSPDMLTGAANQAIFLPIYQAYALINPRPGDESVTCELKVVPGNSLTGKVLDPEGRPLGGSRVAGLRGSMDGSRPLADPDFTAAQIDPERPRYLLALHPGRKLGGFLIVTGKETGPVALKLTPWGSLSARLIDGDGQPIAGAQVGVGYRGTQGIGMPNSGARQMDERIITDRGGRFRLDGLIPGLPVAVYFVKNGTPLTSGDKLDNLDVRPGESKDLGDITARPFGG